MEVHNPKHELYWRSLVALEVTRRKHLNLREVSESSSVKSLNSDPVAELGPTATITLTAEEMETLKTTTPALSESSLNSFGTRKS